MTERINTPKGRGKSPSKGLQILDAAGSLFASQGYAATSMDTIARDAGVSKQTVYSHYGNKEALFMAVVKNECESHQLTATPPAEDPHCEWLYHFAESFAELITSTEVLSVYQMCIAGAQADPHCSELLWQAGPEPTLRGLSEYLQQQQQASVLHIEDIELATSQLVNMLTPRQFIRSLLGLISEQDLADQADNVRRYAKETVALFIRAHQIQR